jgi:CPA2 family monovalent cation:H+ antiporter-2
MKRAVIGGGTLQVVLAGALTTLFALLWTADIKQAIFVGFLVALSSTAIVLKIISDRGELDTPYGRFVVGVLIFQDLCVVLLCCLLRRSVRLGRT